MILNIKSEVNQAFIWPVPFFLPKPLYNILV